ncbi:serine/threonine-protein kinase [Actinophytocola oryzae]|uniref:Serine/threonine protein kinase n=1 Tax=Actinophytocola oryzae TaxID=502181 RepID=A0A4R7V2N7_9PSEU|nr:serine/threonine-protein kinase [Actinophytocola oryzae]TDV43569.1 serine/threonine protein kinase [Actinophytocola oryzae]
MLRPGTKVGPFRVVEHVGAEGTMAEVYRALDDADQTFALKLVPARGTQGTREVETVRRLDHPGIVATFDVAKWEGRFCLVQEWVEGRSLEVELATFGHLEVGQVVEMGISVANALAYAHGLGVLHRDIKPSNVLHAVGGGYKVTDFGAVGLLQPDVAQTDAGEIAGTPLFMAPEQALGAPQTAASDVYGLGLLMYRCLHGSVPGEDSADYIQLLSSRLSTEIEVPPSPLRDVLLRCLAREPEQRYQSAREVLDALVPLSGYRQIRPPSWTGPAPGDRVAGQVPSSAVGQIWPLLAVLAGACVGGAALGWLGGSASHDPGFWWPVVGGVAVAVGALVAAWRVRRLTGRSPEVARQAAGILTGAGERDALTRSMVVEVEQVVARLKGLDARFLGLTMVLLIREAEEAKESADRVAALAQMVTLMEKLSKQLSPWHVRHKEAVATAIAIVGALVGVAGVVSGFLH